MSNDKIKELSKEYLIHLVKLDIKDYKNLGYTSKSIIKVLQTALVTEIENPEFIEHDKWDVYNLLNLLKNLIPESEFEFLDKLKNKV